MTAGNITDSVWNRLAKASLHGLGRYDPRPPNDDRADELRWLETAPLNWNEDLFGPPEYVLAAAARALPSVWRYPESAYEEFRAAAAEYHGVPDASVTISHGAQALICLVAAAFIQDHTPVVIPEITYGLYAQIAAAAGADVTRVRNRDLRLDLDALAAAAIRTRARLIWVCDPNNPTGSMIQRDEWLAFLDHLPETCAVVVDEAYIEFAEPAIRVHRETDVLDGRPVILLRTFSKIFGLAGLRLGYAIADPAVGRLFDAVRGPFDVNRIALAAGIEALARPSFIATRRAEVATARAQFTSLALEAGMCPHPSQANFVLCELGCDDREFCRRLLQRGIAVRGGSEFGLPGYARTTLAPSALMQRAATAMAAARLEALEGRQ